ncbi:MAG TPA: hypothetical protein VH083_04080 [Myxococcales bacterium]|nr:hypothetical protein [Myxococcales bacterium]
MHTVGCRVLALAAAIALLPGTARAIDLADGKLTINGAGAGAFTITDGNDVFNTELVGGRIGSFRNAEFNLIIAVKPMDRITIVTLVFFDEINQIETGLDWSFVEFFVNDALKIRAGEVKLPLGLSNELEPIGTLRPFFALPAAVYGPSSIAADTYFGIGATGEVSLSENFRLGYDVYGGNMSFDTAEPFQALLPNTPESNPGVAVAPVKETVRNVLGGRLSLSTPIEGLNFKVSGYRGSLVDSSLEVVLLSAEYVSDRWSIRTEGYRSVQRDIGNINHGGYIEVAYHFTSAIQAAVQADAMRTHQRGIDEDSPFLFHRGVGLGLNYWFSPGLVAKTSIQQINGNRLAFPTMLAQARESSIPIPESTWLFTGGLQFSF